MNRKYYFSKRLLAKSLMSFCILVIMFITVSSRVGANTQPSPWLSIGDPSLRKDFELSATDSFPDSVAGLGNRDCTADTVITRPPKLLQIPLSTTDCFVRTAFGLVSSNGLIRFTDSRIAGKVVNFGSYLNGVIGIPSSDSTINYTSSPSGGLYLHFYRSIPSPLTVEATSSGEVNYRFNQPGSVSLRDQAGNLLAAQTDSLSFSSNGRWMVVDSPFKATLRVNLETMEVLPFRAAFNYQIGLAPALQTSLSNDGRYVVVTSANNSVMTLYDLSTCSSTPAIISGPVSCQSRDLLPYFKNQFSGFMGCFYIRFTSDNVLTLYVLTTSGNVSKRTRITLIAPGQAQEKVSYLGMGDSFSSGEGENIGGAYYEIGTDEVTNLCHLSKRSYPYLIKADLNIQNFHSVACSGALGSNIIDSGQQGPQYIHNNIDNYWQPGYQRQLDYLSTTIPDFLTITIGGNDVGFSNILTECATSHFTLPLPNTCKYAANSVERANIAKLIASQYSKLRSLYQEIIRATNQKTRIYVVGYPQFIKESGGSCGLNVHLNDQERELVAKSTHYMNQVVKAAAENAGALFLDIEGSLSGKNLCSVVPDSQMAINGLTEGNDKHLPWWSGYLVGGVAGVVGVQRLGIGNESFHPNSNGHYLIHKSIMELTSGDPGSFVTCPNSPTKLVCPGGDGKIPLPDLGYFGTDAYAYVGDINNVSVTSTAYPPEPKIITGFDGSLNTRQARIKVDYMMPSSTMTIKLNSTTVTNFVAGSNGRIDTVVDLSAVAVPGFASLHILGTGIGGEPKDYYQTVFIPGSTNDINNNSVIDISEPCGFAVLSGKDIDMDGIDDSCDGLIDNPPPKLSISVRGMSATN